MTKNGKKVKDEAELLQELIAYADKHRDGRLVITKCGSCWKVGFPMTTGTPVGRTFAEVARYAMKSTADKTVNDEWRPTLH